MIEDDDGGDEAVDDGDDDGDDDGADENDDAGGDDENENSPNMSLRITASPKKRIGKVGASFPARRIANPRTPGCTVYSCLDRRGFWSDRFSSANFRSPLRSRFLENFTTLANIRWPRKLQLKENKNVRGHLSLPSLIPPPEGLYRVYTGAT